MLEKTFTYVKINVYFKYSRGEALWTRIAKRRSLNYANLPE